MDGRGRLFVKLMTEEAGQCWKAIVKINKGNKSKYVYYDLQLKKQLNKYIKSGDH